MAIEGIVHSIETGGTVDGPGMRFVAFLSGCPLRCLYCHNPDSQRPDSGKKTSVEALLDEIAQYKDFLTRTGGGVTASGGEPLFQPEFVTALFKGCKAMGLHTALDTSGFLGVNATDELLSATDLVLLDIKSIDPDTYKKITNVALQPTLDFALRLSSIKKPMWIRYVLVPGLTDNLDHVARLADFLKTLSSVERVEVLPFHKMGEPKWEALGRPYTLKETLPPSQEQTTKVREIFKSRGFETT